jgi:hypothetical protein
MKKYYYKPFGGLYLLVNGKPFCEGLDGSIYDPESELQMMRSRKYDYETGRFNLIDFIN